MAIYGKIEDCAIARPRCSFSSPAWTLSKGDGREDDDPDDDQYHDQVVVGFLTGLMQPRSCRVFWRGREIDLPTQESWATRLYRALYRSV